MSDKYNYDFLVIGAGSGGVRASRIAASYGAKVAVIEESALGGTCVNIGCVPKKILSYAAHFHHDFEDANRFGWTVGTQNHDWATLIKNKNTEIERLNGIYKNLLNNTGVEILTGSARLTGAHSIDVNGTEYTADKILIAVGGWPNKPDISGIEHAITSNEAFYLNALPKRSIVIGGGFIAVEFACIFNGLGSDVTLLHRGDKILRGFDDDIRTSLADEMIKQDIDLRLTAPMPKHIEKIDTGLRVTLDDDTIIETDCIMYAIGRHPKTDGLGLNDLNIQTDKNGAIAVNEHYQTNIDNIYAIGDVTNRVNLTPVALAEGHALADTLFGNNPRDISYDNIASAVFSHPPIGTVGLTEDDARAKYNDITVYTSSFRPMKHTISGRDEKSFMKLVVDTKTDKIVGCHMMGADAPEIMQGISIAINAGATKADFDRTIGIHPTAAEEFVTMRTARD